MKSNSENTVETGISGDFQKHPRALIFHRKASLQFPFDFIHYFQHQKLSGCGICPKETLSQIHPFNFLLNIEAEGCYNDF